jgi:RNA polymerase sigma-70 factor (ECF subfamily)
LTATELFESHRPLLFSIAYRMLGSATDAEDVLQDAWVRLNGTDAEAVRSPKAFATTIVTRLCLDRLKSARAQREEYIGPWLPEPVLTSGGESPDVLAQRSESVTLAFLVLLETLNPEERAVFLLKEVFDYGHAAIAEMLGTTAANSRQLLHRAKARIAEARDRVKTAAAGDGSGRRVAERFAAAFSSGDAGQLAALLSRDVSFLSDGGGKAFAARRPVHGRDEVVHMLVGFARTAEKMGLLPRASLQIAEVNAEPALVLRLADRLESVFVLTVTDQAIESIRVVRNPEKLAYIDRQLRTVM